MPGSLDAAYAHCPTCRSGKQPFNWARSYGPYSGNLRTLIRKFKFDSYPLLAGPLVELLVESWRTCDLTGECDWIVPVPLHSSRRKERGFDQTLLLSRGLAQRLGVMLFCGLARTRPTRPQFGLDRRRRRRNVRHAFGLSRESRLRGKDVLVVDDIMTTGATVCEVSRVLRRKARVKRVFVLTLARVSPYTTMLKG